MSAGTKRLYFGRFSQLDRALDNPEALVTLFSPDSYHLGYHPRPALPGSPVSERLSRLCKLMNNEATAFLYGPSSQDPARVIWPGNTDGPSRKDCRMHTAAIPYGYSASNPE